MEHAELGRKTYSSLEPGQVIGPERHRFKLIEAGASHAPGQLWKAEDLSTREPVPVALLIFDPCQFADDDQISRLRDALNRSRTISSPRLMPIFGQFSYRGLLFIAMPDLNKGMTLKQLIDQKRLTNLSDKQRIGIATQLGKALHAVQMGRSFHGTLCPELIYLIPGQGMQLLGTGWYNALDPDTTQLSFPQYQLAIDLEHGTASTLGDTHALGQLITLIFNKGQVAKENKPADLNEHQWSLLSPLLTDPEHSAIHTPIQLIRELFIEEPDAEQLTGDSALESDDIELPVAEAIEATESPVHSADKGSPENHQPSVETSEKSTDKRSVFSKFKTWDRALWLITGFILGFALNYLLTQALQKPVPETPPASPTTLIAPEKAPSPGAEAMVTQGDNRITPLDPVKEAESLKQNHLQLFRHQIEGQFTGPLMVTIPTGRFLMGDLQGQGDDNEQPVHEVVVDKPYALSRYEITFDDYDQFAEATGRAKPDDQGWGRGQRPVINVSWTDAQAYTQWLAKLTHEPYRLPSEAEWEYAARAGTETNYWWGNILEKGLARCDGCESGATSRITSTVGSYPPNPWGLHDFNGNVDEWVADCYSDNYLGANNDQTPFRLGSCSQRTIRGGSWFEIPRLVRSSSRYRHPASAHRDSWGFRIALDLN